MCGAFEERMLEGGSKGGMTGLRTGSDTGKGAGSGGGREDADPCCSIKQTSKQTNGQVKS